MGLLSPWFLAGLAAVAVPVWLHLLRRHQGVPRPFSSLMFFERRAQSSIKHRRIRYWLLLALRAAVVTLLALAFAKPFVSGRAAAAASGPRLTVLAVDHSWSMRQGDRLSRAKAAAAGALSSLGPAEQAQVLSFARRAELHGAATADRGALRAALQTIEATDSRSSYGELAGALRALAESAPRPLEVHLFSDMQKTSLPPAFNDLRLPAGARLAPHPVGAARLPNWTVETVTAPRHLYEPRQARVRATVASFGAERASRRVSLVVNNRVQQTKEVEIPAGGRATAEFDALEAAYGWNRCEVRLEGGDAFPADDRFYFAVERGEARAVLFIHARRDARSPLYFRHALEAAGGGAFRLEPVSAEEAGRAEPRKYAFVVLSDAGALPKEFEDALREYTRRGGAVLIALGPSATALGGVPLVGWKLAGTRYSARDQERFQSVAAFDSGHPAGFRGEGVKFYQAAQVEPGEARVLARLSDHTPLLLEERLGEGRVLVFASTFDNLANDFPLHASWVPFIDRAARYLGRLEELSASLTVDAYLELRSGGAGGAALEVLDPRGRRALSLEESSARPSLVLAEQGFYTLHRPDGRQELVAVNADRAESDFETVPAETLALWQNTGAGASGGSGETAEQEERAGWWWRLLAALLVVSLVESLVGNRYLTPGAGSPFPRRDRQGAHPEALADARASESARTPSPSRDRVPPGRGAVLEGEA